MTDSTQLPPWLKPTWQRMLQLLDKPPSALLLSSSGSTAADGLSALWSRQLLCEQGAAGDCSGCRSCRELDAGVHPDFRCVETAPDKREIGIDQVRDAIQWAGQTARRQHRVLYIRFAEQLGMPAANALLKTLEEPVASLTILLSTRRAEALPVTIRSRCLRLPLPVPGLAAMRDWLGAQGLKGSRLEQALQLHPADGIQALSLDDEGAKIAQRYQKAWTMGWVEGDALAAAELLDEDDWPRAVVWLQRKVLETLRDGGPAALASVWDALILLRRGERIAFNRLLLLEELFMLLRRAKTTS